MKVLGNLQLQMFHLFRLHCRLSARSLPFHADNAMRCFDNLYLNFSLLHYELWMLNISDRYYLIIVKMFP